MFITFFQELREAGVPVSVKEFLAFLEGLQRRVIDPDAEAFYFLARTALVKDERFLDAFDQVFAQFFKGAEKAVLLKIGEIPEEWLKDGLSRAFTEEELKEIQALGGLEALLEAFRRRREEQDGEHHGGNKWIGTGGTSPFGSGGAHPEGVRVGNQGQRRKSAVKVWEQRSYKGLSGDVQLNTRNIKMALRRLRVFTREGNPDELDLDGTIRRLGWTGAMLDVLMQPSRRNRVKVLLFLDIGGSMDPYVRQCEQLFSSARAAFKHLETFYFHNCVYESVWRDEHRWEGKLKTFEILHKYNRDYRVILVGDASMSPYELLQAGGSVDHFNDEAGVVWLQRLKESFPHLVWLNPEPEDQWEYVESTRIIRRLVEGRMYPLTLNGLASAMDLLRKKHKSSAGVPLHQA
jgi:uncharacterized protein with von Willebrand factor type A (vWA) domain